MAVTKEAVLAGLDAVPSPDGTPLPRTGKLSEIVVSDSKVFFSITVDAAVVQAWEPVRKAAEAAVRGVPGVTSALVALTGERHGQYVGFLSHPAAVELMCHLFCAFSIEYWRTKLILS